MTVLEMDFPPLTNSLIMKFKVMSRKFHLFFSIISEILSDSFIGWNHLTSAGLGYYMGIKVKNDTQ